MSLQTAPNISWKEINGFIVVVNVTTGNYYSLNRTASAVWSRLLGGDAVHAISRSLTASYDIDEATAGGDIRECITQWLNEGLIVAAGEDSGEASATAANSHQEQAPVDSTPPPEEQ